MSATIVTLADAEREHIIKSIRECKGILTGKRGAVGKLNISRSQLTNRMRRLGISKHEVQEIALECAREPLTEEVAEAQMVRDVTQTRTGLIRQAKKATSRTYGTIDYIARNIFRGEENMVAYAQLVAEDGDERFALFIETWERERNCGRPRATGATLAALVKEAGINSIDFCVEVMRSCMKRNMEISNIYAGLAHPKVVQRNIKEALKVKGIKDREMFFQHTGWVPTPKGSTINVHAQATTNASAVAASSTKTENTPLPEFEERTIEGSKIAREEFEDAP